MKQTKILMGMHVTVEIEDSRVKRKDFDAVFDYFSSIDRRFSTYKETSEISKINRGLLKPSQYSSEMKIIFRLSEQTKEETNGYFDIAHGGKFDPSGVVKGWAIFQASKILENKGFQNFYIDAGGDIQVNGKNAQGKDWTIGIRNPFKDTEIVKVVSLQNQGIATSGTSVRGQHIYNPLKHSEEILDIVSVTVIAPNVYEADRFATASFAMGKRGIYFLESLPGFEGYMIDKNGIATYTSGFETYVLKNSHDAAPLYVSLKN